MSILAAIDIGSNAMRLAIGTFSSNGKPLHIVTHRESVRLGADVFKDGHISEITIKRTVAALKHFKKEIIKSKVVAVRAVATSAMREARNAQRLVDKIQRTTGIEVEVISGLEEGYLVFKGVDRMVDLSRKSTLLIDIGGGSVETCIISGGKRTLSESVKLGSVRLLEMVKGRKDPHIVLQRLVRRYAQGVRGKIARKSIIHRLQQFVGTGGNIECFGNLSKRLFHKKRSDSISLKELEAIVAMLAKMKIKERITKLKLRKDRADVILPAGVLLLAIMRETKIKRLKIPGVGLKEGTLFELAERWHSHAGQR